MICRLLIIVLLISGSSMAQPPGNVQEIIPLAENLYRARNGNWYTIFLVTDEGIVLADPISTPFSQWLKAELDSRFAVPVRYVIYSHSHFDHASGGAVFAATATFIAHENMRHNMDGRFPQMPGDMIDRDSNGVFDWDDIMIPTEAHPGICGWGPSFFTIFDANEDGVVSPAELFTEVRPPDLTYSERMQLSIGGYTVELLYPGRNHSDDATVIHFTDQRIVFASEFLADALVTDEIRSLPSACGPFDGSPLDEWIASYRAVEALDFDRVAPGHGDVFDKRFVAETRGYFEALKNAVASGMAAGRTLEQLKNEVLLEDYSGWRFYERLRQNNIEAAYRNLQQR